MDEAMLRRVLADALRGAAAALLPTDLARPTNREFTAQRADVSTSSGPETVAEPSSSPLALSIPEAAKRLGVSRSVVYSLLSSHELPSVSVGRRRLVLTESLAAWLKAREV